MYKRPPTRHSQCKEKENGADKYDFLREPWSWDSKIFVKPLLHKIFAQKPSGMPGEQEHHISSVPFFFFITYKITTCERTLIHAPSAPEKAPQNLRHYANETMDTYLISVKLEQVNTYISDTNNQI